MIATAVICVVVLYGQGLWRRHQPMNLGEEWLIDIVATLGSVMSVIAIAAGSHRYLAIATLILCVLPFAVTLIEVKDRP